MKKLFTLKTMLLALFCVLGVNAWGATYTKVTSAPTDWSGDYLLVATNTSGSTTTYYAWNGTFGSWGTCVALTSSELSDDKNTITTTSTSSFAEMTIATATGGYTLKNGTDFLAKTEKKFNSSTTSVVFGYIALNSDGTVVIQGSNAESNAYGIRYNHNSGSGGFRVYKAQGTSIAFFLYKKTASTQAYTVTFNAGTNGTCDCSDTENHQLTEASANAGVTLPSCTPNSGYNFVGWSTTEGGTSANAGVADATYRPTSNCTLYAVYKQYYTLTITQPSEGGALTVKNGETPLSSGAQVNVGTNLTCEVTEIPEGKRFSRFYAEWDNSQSKYKSTNPATFDNIDTENITALAVRVAYQDLAQFTINYIVNGQNTNPQENVWEETALVFPTPSAIYGKKFVGWTETPIDGTTNSEPTLVSTAGLKASANKTYYAVFATFTAGTGTKKTDNITRAVTGITNGATTYSNWSNKTVTGGSSAVYAGNSAGNYNTVQIRSNNSNSGVVSTTSGGAISKVTLTWNSNTPNSETLVRKVEVYGSNSAYTQAIDLYDDGKKGTLLGTITRHLNETEVTVSGNYAYIGIRSNDATIYLDNIAIEWVSGSLDTYSEYCTTVPSSAQITVSAAGYSTYYNSASAYTMPANMEGYVWFNGALDKGFDAGDVVPASEPLVLKAAQGTYTLNFTENAASHQYKADSMNDLDGTDTETALTTDASSYFYGLSLNAAGETSSVGFYWMAADGAAFTNGAHKAYLKLAKTSGAPIMAFPFNDDTTGVSELTVQSSKIKDGKFIENGKIVIVKNGVKYNVAGQVVK